MTKYSTAIPATLILSLFSSVVHGQNYDERNGRLLKSSYDFQCFSDGLHVDPNDCAVFYRCTDWGESSENSIQSRFTAMKFRCAEGTVFDIERSTCVNIEETSRLECRQLADDDTFGRIFERQAGDPDYGVVQSQSGYNRPYQPPSYNRPGPEETGEQNPGDSGDGGGEGGENNNQPSSPSTSPPCEADGFFPIPNDCTHFYRCVSSGNGFLKYEFSCGPGTVWDPDNNACNHPWATSRPDCKSGTDGNQGGGPETIEISETPESAAQVAESSSTTTSAPSTTTSSPSTNKPTTRPSQSGTSSSTRPSTIKPSSTTTKRSTTVSSSTTTTTEEPSGTSPVTQSPKDNTTSGENSCISEGFFPDGKNCTKFYRCVDEGNGKFKKYEFECAEGTVWDVQETTCNYPYAVQNDNCNSTSSESQTASTAGQSTSSTSQTSSRPTSTPSSSYNRPTSQGSSSNRPTSSTSSSYNRPTSQSTSSTNQQSSSSQTTSGSSQTSSSSSQTTSSSSQTSSSSSQTSSSSSQTTSSQSSSSTSSTSSQSTSSNQQTSSSQQSSGSTSSSSSQNNTTTSNSGSTTSSNNSSQTSKDDKCSEEGFFPSSENCNKFYRCVSNEAGGFTKYNFNCGPGTVWDSENNVCNHPWAVNDEKCRSGAQGTTPMGESTTESSSTSSSQNGTTPLSSSTTQNSNKTTVTPTTESSSQPSSSVTTTESSSKPTETPDNSTTEPSSKPTETPDNSNATTTTDSTDSSTTSSNNSTATTTEAGSKNSTKPNKGIKCEKAGYYPDPKDCKKFYRCVDWDGDKGKRFSVYHFDCPAGTIFDPALDICNHEESVYPPRDCTGNGSQTTDSPSTSKPDNTTTTESPTTTDSSNSTDSTTDNTSEPTTIQPTTDASTNATEPTTTGSSETTPQTTTVSESTTKKETETTTAITTVTTSPASTNTPEQTSTQPTTTEISTTPSSSETCPELGPDQYALVCPTGFRRHPKFCNLFYQCTVSKSMDTKIVILSCVNGTLYDEKKIQCLPPDETKKCDGTMMPDSRNLKTSDDSVSPIAVKSDKSICPNEGSFSYKDDCRLFYKCKKDEQGKLTGFLYQCPEGFAFWSVSKRCEKTEKVPCENSKNKSPTSWKSTLAPVESRNIGF